MVHAPFAGVHSGHSHGCQDAPHGSHIPATERSWEPFLDAAEDFSGGKQDALFVFFCQSEALEEHFLFGQRLVEGAVVCLNLLFLFRGEPVPFSGEQFRFQLGIELCIVGLRAINFSLYLHTEEASASRGVGQQLFLVGGADEGGDSGELAVIVSVRLAERQLLQLHQVLQCRHGSDAVSVELVHVDEAEEREFLFASAYARDVELVDVEALQFFRQEDGAEGRLATSLFGADEQGSHGIGALRVEVHPLCHHA